MSTLTTLIVIASLLFGGAGATVYAAQDSQPDQALYGLKLVSEDARLELSAQTQTRLELALAFAERRVEELAALVRAGEPVPTALAARWQQQVELALRLSANLEEGALNGELLQVREQLRQQLRLLEQLQGSAPEDAQLLRLREQLQTRLRLVEDGLADPAGFRSQVRAGNFGSEPGNPWTEETPTPGSGYGPGTCDTCTPQGTGVGPQGGNPWVDAETSEPGYGPGQNDDAGNPWTEGTPTPGSSYGPGPGDCGDCTPQGPAPQPTGGNPDTGQGDPSSSGGNGSGNGGKKP